MFLLHHRPFPQQRPLPHGLWRAVNQHAMESRIPGCVSVSASGYRARVHSNISISISIIVSVSLWLLPVPQLRTLGICRRQVPTPQPR